MYSFTILCPGNKLAISNSSSFLSGTSFHPASDSPSPWSTSIITSSKYTVPSGITAFTLADSTGSEPVFFVITWYVKISPSFIWETSCPPLIVFNSVSKTGPAPVSNVIKSRFTFCLTVVVSSIYDIV